MKVLQVNNQYRNLCAGTERVVTDTMALMAEHGVAAKLVMRSSRGLEKSLLGKVRAFASGVYSWSAYKEMVRTLRQECPDVIHVHNLYPLFSPSVLVACRREGIPTVMTLHNYDLTCPIGCHLYRSSVCERCLGGREYWCILRNCRGRVLESVAYALRRAVALRSRVFHRNVSRFIALTHFGKMRMVEAGLAEARISVVPNMVALDHPPVDPSGGQYAAFAGRMSPEKGVDTLLAAARRLPAASIVLAGDGPCANQLAQGAPSNATFVGRLDHAEMGGLYRRARFVVVPNKWFEMCPLVISGSMSYGLPVIASRIGGLPELVDDGVTGLLFEPGNAEDLAQKMGLL